MESNPISATYNSDFVSSLSKEFLDIQATIEFEFTLKGARDITRTYSLIHCTDKYSQHCSNVWPFSLICWVFIYELSACEFKPTCSHLNSRFRACFEEGVYCHLVSYIGCILTKTRTWNDKKIQSNAPYRQVLTIQPNHLARFGKSLSLHLWTKWLWVWIHL